MDFSIPQLGIKVKYLSLVMLSVAKHLDSHRETLRIAQDDSKRKQHREACTIVIPMLVLQWKEKLQ